MSIQVAVIVAATNTENNQSFSIAIQCLAEVQWPCFLPSSCDCLYKLC